MDCFYLFLKHECLLCKNSMQTQTLDDNLSWTACARPTTTPTSNVAVTSALPAPNSLTEERCLCRDPAKLPKRHYHLCAWIECWPNREEFFTNVTQEYSPTKKQEYRTRDPHSQHNPSTSTAPRNPAAARLLSWTIHGKART